MIRVPTLRDGYVPPADILVATAWNTAEAAADFPSSRGLKHYLIQGFETWNGETERVLATYRLPFTRIAVSTHLAHCVQEAVGPGKIEVVSNGCDFELSPSLNAGKRRPYDIGMVYARPRFKQSDVGLRALDMVRRRYPALRVLMFGAHGPRETPAPGTRCLVSPPQNKIPELYASADIWISSSPSEGFCLPALEASRMGCAIAAVDNGGIRDIIKDGENGLLTPPNDPEALARAIFLLLENPRMKDRLVSKSLAHSRNFNWTRAADSLEALFHRSLREAAA